jgi:ankyrin repeat protein
MSSALGLGLHNAIREGDNIDWIKQLLARNAPINERDNYGMTPLLLAAKSGRNDLVVFLLENNAVIDGTDGTLTLWTALHFAAQNGHNEVVQTLLKNNATLNATCWNGWTALHIATIHAHIEVVQTLLANNAAINAKETHGWTPLHYACQNYRLEIAKTLLAYNAAIDEKTNEDGFTPLHLAALYGRDKMVATLIDNGAAIDEKTKTGTTALCLAAQNRHDDVVHTLIVYNAAIGEMKNALQYLASLSCLQQKFVTKARVDLIRSRALQICIGLQSLHLDALRTCEILLFACAIENWTIAQLIPFHIWWNIATFVKHFS